MKSIKTFNALLIARRDEAAWALPRILSKAGFNIDAITSAPLIKNNSFLREADLIPLNKPFISAILRRINFTNYDWIIVTDDESLIEIFALTFLLKQK